ncbi:hypothetical protein Taro_018952 [Colocasia esculenta]|uniref:Uncharacterized protein n=1 Tax=Colocasia esculenta TaxID=4460 RepID=A0A843USF4_COLES|nr:hypothetical protein [Colocasia esculenta]
MWGYGIYYGTLEKPSMEGMKEMLMPYKMAISPFLSRYRTLLIPYRARNGPINKGGFTKLGDWFFQGFGEQNLETWSTQAA